MPANLTLMSPGFAAGYFGQALIGGYGSAAAITASTHLFVGGWMTFGGTGSDPVGVVVGQTSFFWLGFTSAGVPTARYGGDAQHEVALTAAAAMPSGVHHLALGFGPGGGFLFVDGQIVASSTTTLAASAPSFAAADIQYGLQVQTFGSVPGQYHNSGALDELALFDREQTAAFAPQTAPYAGTEANLLRLFHLDGNGTDSAGAAAAPAGLAVDRLDVAVTPSPYTWHDDGKSLNANSTGSYLTLGFTGTSIALDTVALAAGLHGYPVVRAFIDDLPHVDVTLAVGQANFVLASGLAAGSHKLKLAIVSFDQQDSYWTLASAVKITGFTLDPGASASAVAKNASTALWLADSLCMGYLINADGTMDGTQTLPWLLDDTVGAEFGQLGYGGQGYEVAGGGGVPKLPDTFPYYSSGVPRLVNGLLSPQPDDIYDMHGTNPVSGQYVATQADVAGMIATYRAAAPSARIWMIVPPGGYARAAKTAAVAACGDAKVYLLDAGPAFDAGLDTPGTASEAASDGIHLYVRTNARFAGRIGPLRQAALAGGATNITIVKRFFRQGFWS